MGHRVHLSCWVRRDCTAEARVLSTRKSPGHTFCSVLPQEDAAPGGQRHPAMTDLLPLLQ